MLRKGLFLVARVAGERTSSGQAKVASLVGLANVVGNSYEEEQQTVINQHHQHQHQQEEEKEQQLKTRRNMILNVEEAASAVDDLHAAIVNRVGMRSLVNAIQSPFADVAAAGYTLLRNAATHGWGLEAISVTPGLMETLLDREKGAGSSQKACEWRFAVLQALHMTLKRYNGAERYIDGSTRERLAEFVRQGPYYKERGAPQVKVATATR